MSAITSEWQFINTETPATHPAGEGRACSREEEFRAALDKYIAEYDEHQRRRAAMVDGAGGGAQGRLTAWLGVQIGIWTGARDTRTPAPSGAECLPNGRWW